MRPLLERLFEAVQSDGVEYLAPLEDRWGEIAEYPDLINEPPRASPLRFPHRHAPPSRGRPPGDDWDRLACSWTASAPTRWASFGGRKFRLAGSLGGPQSRDVADPDGSLRDPMANGGEEGFAAKRAIDALRRRNVATAPVLCDAGISERDLAASGPLHHRISAAGQSRLLDSAAEAIEDTAFGLHLAEQTDPRDAGIGSSGGIRRRLSHCSPQASGRRRSGPDQSDWDRAARSAWRPSEGLALKSRAKISFGSLTPRKAGGQAARDGCRRPSPRPRTQPRPEPHGPAARIRPRCVRLH